jgi:glycosyltransferase involved in cell wall biosynthesis
VAAALRTRGIGPVELWERGIDPKAFSPSYRSDALRARIGVADEPLLLFVGRLVREKNVELLAEAAERLERAGHRFRLAFVGEGPMLAELRQRLPRAHFAGWQHGEDLARWYASADLFVFPSTTETFGNVVLEGFASGLPAIVADAGGPRDLVTHGVNGRLAEPDSVDDFAAQLEALLAQPSEVRRLRHGALETATRYRWAQVNRRLVESYERLIAARRAPRPDRLSA